MKALSYLMIKQFKNRILAIKKKPAMLILYGVILLMIIISVISMMAFDNKVQTPTFSDERIMYLIITGFGLLYLFIFTTTGLSTGSTLFSMADVGLLFVAPISSKKILLYGLISTMGKALFAAVFILYQVVNLRVQFGYGMKEIIALFIIYAILVLISQLLSIAIYIYSNGNPFRKNLVKTILYTATGALIIAVLLLQQKEQLGVMEAVFRMVDSNWFGYIPIVGWAVLLFKGVAGGTLLSVVISLAFFLIMGILIISLLTIGSADYYEDVLLSTEVSYQTMQAAKEGRRVQRRNNKVKVREEDEGILKGKGAIALFYKHILEMKRSSRFVFIDSYTLFVMVGVGIAGYNFKNKGAVYGILGVIIYLQFFLTIMGRLKNELLKPYIYLIPEKSIKKVISASITSLLKPCVDGVCIFAVLFTVGGADLLTCIFLAFAYSGAGAMFIGITVLYQRVLGGQPNKLVQMFIGMSILLAVLAPAITSSFIAAYLLPVSLAFLCTLPFTLFCILFAFLMFLACGNLIDKSEFTGKL